MKKKKPDGSINNFTLFDDSIFSDIHSSTKQKSVKETERNRKKSADPVSKSKHDIDDGGHGKVKSHDKVSKVRQAGKTAGKTGNVGIKKKDGTSAESVVKSKRRTDRTNDVGNSKKDSGKKEETHIKNCVKRVKYNPGKVKELMPETVISGDPVKVFGKWDIAEIDLNGERRQVSKWSVRNGKYVQGLDSEFIVHCYRPDKKQFK